MMCFDFYKRYSGAPLIYIILGFLSFLLLTTTDIDFLSLVNSKVVILLYSSEIDEE